MHYPFTDNFDKDCLLSAMMGPNAMRITEELTSSLAIKPGMRILDLGCGMGISSVLLARKYDATVFAADLWIEPSDNALRFESLRLGDRIIPFSVDARLGLPFAHDYFDVLISVDAYHYFGNNETMLPSLLPYIKPEGMIGVAVPGLKKEFEGGVVPDALLPYWEGEINFYTPAWWQELWARESGIDKLSCSEMECCEQAWQDWLESPSPYAQRDIGMLEAENGEYFNIISLVARRRA